MRPSVSAALLAIACTLLPAAARADSPAPAKPHAYVGLQALLLAGVHRDIYGSQNGVAGGAILQAGVQGTRFEARFEGIPPVSLPQPPSVSYGQATPQLSLFNGAVRAAVDRRADLWLGAGMTIINQRTPLPNLQQVVASRLAGVRYELQYRHPITTSRFLEFTLGGAPHLTGTDIYTYSTNHPVVDKPEVASELDGMLAIGFAHSHYEWLFGIRTINFSAMYPLTGEEADRNNGAGILAEWRDHIGR